MSATILMPIPHKDFDPTEVSITWSILRDAGFTTVFATADGQRGYADEMMISGEGLDLWGFIPGLKKLKAIGLLLRADRFARAAYRELEQDSLFLDPIKFNAVDINQFDALVLPGGHAPGMRPYLENSELQQLVVNFFEHSNVKPIASICHGAVLAARSISEKSNKSVLYGLKTTALPWSFEAKAWKLCKYFIRFWDANYYRTYQPQSAQPSNYASVEEEVKRSLADPSDFLNVPRNSNYYAMKTNAFSRDRIDDNRPAFIVQDGRYISARWPGDAHTFALKLVDLIKDYQNQT